MQSPSPSLTRILLWSLSIGALILVLFWLADAFLRDKLTPDTGHALPNHVVIGYTREPVNWLMVTAAFGKYFQDAGVDFELREYPSGKRALVAFFNEEADLVTAADVPLALPALQGKSFRILATLGASTNEMRIASRADRGIRKPVDLAGKRLATQKGSAVHLFLDLFLLKHGIQSSKIYKVFLKAEDLPSALADGNIDAFAMREPYLSQARDLLGDRLIVFEAPGLYRKTFNLVVLPGYLERHRTVVKRLLSGLVAAYRWVQNHPFQAQTLIAQATSIPIEEIRSLWPQVELRLSLDQALIISLDEAARWSIDQDLVRSTTVPNFLEWIDFQMLSAAAPDAVTLIH